MNAFYFSLPHGVTVAQLTLDQFVKVRILVRQPPSSGLSAWPLLYFQYIRSPPGRHLQYSAFSLDKYTGGFVIMAANPGHGASGQRMASGPRRSDIMAYKITDKCVACGTCAGECPVEAISAGSPIYVIDPDKCVSCGTCAGACPMEAIVAE